MLLFRVLLVLKQMSIFGFHLLIIDFYVKER